MKKNFILLVFLSFVLAMSCSTDTKRQPGIKHIDAQELKDMLSIGEDPILLDVRTKGEYNGPLGHLEGSVLIPMHELEKRVSELDDYQDRLIVIYCRSGNRSQVAAQFLMKHNLNVVNLVGGMKAWNKLK